MTPASHVVTPPQELYLTLLKGCLTRELMPERYRPLRPGGAIASRLYEPFAKVLEQRRLGLVRPATFDAKARAEGRDWPLEAETMIGSNRLDAIQTCATEILDEDVPGDLLEAGVWRGGATILMRAVLEAYGDGERRVWVADSFMGVPHTEDGHPFDRDDYLGGRLAVGLDAVKDNFRRYGLLDSRVVFLPGWFKDTLPTASVEQLALIRMDGDLYESTIVTLRSLYPKLSIGGYVLVDDYFMANGTETGVKIAVDEYRAENGITDELQRVDWNSVLWRRGS
jgi:O-methyltransferase